MHRFNPTKKYSNFRYLENDFGFSQNELRVFFSGHRGYHLHIENEAVRSLDAMARKEIVDYVTGLGLAVLDKEER